MVTNLQIAHIELRSEESFDIQPYIHERKVEKMVVALDGEIMDIKTRFEKVWTDNTSRNMFKKRILHLHILYLIVWNGTHNYHLLSC